MSVHLDGKIESSLCREVAFAASHHYLRVFLVHIHVCDTNVGLDDLCVHSMCTQTGKRRDQK